MLPTDGTVLICVAFAEPLTVQCDREIKAISRKSTMVSRRRQADVVATGERCNTLHLCRCVHDVAKPYLAYSMIYVLLSGFAAEVSSTKKHLHSWLQSGQHFEIVGQGRGVLSHRHSDIPGLTQRFSLHGPMIKRWHNWHVNNNVSCASLLKVIIAASSLVCSGDSTQHLCATGLRCVTL